MLVTWGIMVSDLFAQCWLVWYEERPWCWYVKTRKKVLMNIAKHHRFFVEVAQKLLDEIVFPLIRRCSIAQTQRWKYDILERVWGNILFKESHSNKNVVRPQDLSHNMFGYICMLFKNTYCPHLFHTFTFHYISNIETNFFSLLFVIARHNLLNNAHNYEYQLQFENLIKAIITWNILWWKIHHGSFAC